MQHLHPSHRAAEHAEDLLISSASSSIAAHDHVADGTTGNFSP
jgi:hypothetical protein